MQICSKTLEFQQLFQEWNEKKQEMINNNCFIAHLDHAAIPREIFGTWKSMFTQVKVFEKLLKCILSKMKPYLPKMILYLPKKLVKKFQIEDFMP